jgi:hypothetical protein
MPDKLLRLGYTECSLLFIYWLNNYKNVNNGELINTKANMINWLYTTSGYYDKTQLYTYFNIVHNKDDTRIYRQYMETIFEFIKNSDYYMFAFHEFTQKGLIEEFKRTIQPKNDSYIYQHIVYDFIKNKKLLVISPFSKLIKSQIDSGNYKRIYPDATTVEYCLEYTYPYTFFNNGPHNNILETAEYNFNIIMQTVTDEYDSVLIGCGAYSCLLAKKFYDIGKNVCTLGGDLQTYFGIANTRLKNDYLKNNLEFNNKEYWILEIPEEYKPVDYMKIEDGCYW